MKKIDRNTIPLSASTELEERLAYQYKMKHTLELAIASFEYEKSDSLRRLVDLKYSRVCKRIARIESTMRVRTLI